MKCLFSRLEKEALALEVELLKQLRDLGGDLKDGNNNNEEVHLLHSTRLGDQELQTPDHFQSEKLGIQPLGRGGGPIFGEK